MIKPVNSNSLTFNATYRSKGYRTKIKNDVNSAQKNNKFDNRVLLAASLYVGAALLISQIGGLIHDKKQNAEKSITVQKIDNENKAQKDTLDINI